MKDRKLYVERWLLEIQNSATRAGMEARVRAIDFRGGKWLSLDVRGDGEDLQICYRKSRLGARMAAAATAAGLAGRLREVHGSLLGEHPGLLESGVRRFLRKSIHILDALESGLSRGEGRAGSALAEARAPDGARPAAVIRRHGEKRGQFEVLPGAAYTRGGVIQFAAFLEGRLVVLPDLLPRKRGEEMEETEKAPQVQYGASEITLDVTAGTICCLSDAACGAIDCGGLDCLPF